MRHQIDTSNELRAAISKLFDGDADGLSFLEIDGSAADGGNASVYDRATQLRVTLETYIINMARELDELGADESERLRAEARATLIAIRELVRCFPEADPSNESRPRFLS